MTKSAGKKVRLYEVALENGRSASPFVWRIRYALAHKGIAFESVYLGFTEIPTVFGGKFKTVPILEHGDTVMAESWDIAEYLDDAFPDRPPLFASPGELASIRLIDAWFMNDVLRKMFRLYVKDVHDAARPHWAQAAELYLQLAVPEAEALRAETAQLDCACPASLN